MTNRIRVWLYGLGAAFIGGGASAVTAGISVNLIDPNDFNFAEGLWHTLTLMAVAFLVNGVLHVFGYLAKSPLPQPWDGTDRRNGE